MKFFSRKALLASATAVAVSFGGASVASAQSTTPVVTTTPADATTTPADETTTTTKDGSSISDMKPSEIRDWIAVFTAVIGALGTLLAFMGKYFNLPFGK